MVAEVQPQASEIPTKGPKSIKPRGSTKGHAVPIATRIKVRNMYLTLGLAHKEIAERANIPVVTVQNIISRDKLAVEKRRKVKEAIERSQARVDETYLEFEDATARESEEITLGALERAKKSVASRSKFAPKDFQAWTAGLTNLVKVSRTMRGLDQPQAQAGAGTTNIALQLFCVQGDLAPAKAEPTRVQPLPINANDTVSTEPIRGENTLT